MWIAIIVKRASVVPMANASGPRPTAYKQATIAAKNIAKSTILKRKRKPKAPESRIITALTKPVSTDTVLVCGRPLDLVQNTHPVGR